MLKEPRFQEDRLALAKEQTLQEMKKRNDDSARHRAPGVERPSLREKHFTNRFPPPAAISSITATTRDLPPQAGSTGSMNRGGLPIGAFDRPQMVRKLEAAFAVGRARSGRAPRCPPRSPPPPPASTRIEKDVNQGRVSLGLPPSSATTPDIYALEVMNEILAAAASPLTITKTVRSDEGLAYSAGRASASGSTTRALSAPLPSRRAAR